MVDELSLEEPWLEDEWSIDDGSLDNEWSLDDDCSTVDRVALVPELLPVEDRLSVASETE